MLKHIELLPILICFLPCYEQPVRRGTNGGVTKAGLLAAAAAGCIIGLTFVVLGFSTTRCTFDVALKQLLVIPLSALAGLGGSLIDSLLGATLQFSGFCSVRNKVSLIHFLLHGLFCFVDLSSLYLYDPIWVRANYQVSRLEFMFLWKQTKMLWGVETDKKLWGLFDFWDLSTTAPFEKERNTNE